MSDPARPELPDAPRFAPLAGGPVRALVMLLHGYGSNGEEMLHFAGQMRQAFPTAAFVAPNAPQRLAPLAEGRQWWPITSFSTTELAAGAIAAAPALDDVLTAELAVHGLSEDRLVLAGFSQGMMMALHVGLRRTAPLAGIVGLSGMLVAPESLAGELRSRPPVLLVHGTADDVVPFRAQDMAVRTLRALDVPVETHISPGIGHGIAPDGMAAVAAFTAKVLAKAA